ncbi:GDP-D-glucose phosphorylase 1-like isoform X2 [Asterias amurensis]
MLQFVYSKEDLLERTLTPDGHGRVQLSKFDEVLRSTWDEAAENGYFRYQLEELQTKILPGPMQYVVQLNIKRAVERRPAQNIVHVNQPFNPDLFNFTKVKTNEILLELQPQRNGNDSTVINDTQRSNHNAIIINVSPLEQYHVLIVPRRFECLPQSLSEDAIHLALDTLLLSSQRSFRVGFNSLCGLASVNHQHFHGYDCQYKIPIETAAARHVIGQCFELADWPVRGFIFQLKGSTVERTASAVYKVASVLQRKEIAHNLFMTRGDELNPDGPITEQTVRIILWPRHSSFGVRKDAASVNPAGFNVALCELAGHIPVFLQDIFDAMTEEMAKEVIRKRSLPLEEFEALKDEVREVFR